MGTGTSRSFTSAGTGGRPWNAGRPNRLWRFLEIAAILSLSALVACSREPAPHVGEWSGQLYYKDFTKPLEAHFLFHHDGRVEYSLRSLRMATEDRKGNCSIEYDKHPPRLYLEFSDGTALKGLVTFFGREKTIMHVGIVPDGPPSHFSETSSYFFLVKNERKASAAPE